MAHQLRLALGMRGGVSLAVWIGGAAVEIDHLVRGDTSFWRDVLAPSAYDDVIVDVIAGASAGGLNGVLLAASQQYGFRLDAVRDLWLQVGGIEQLLRHPDSADAPSPSLLDGDRRFLGVVHEKLVRLIAGAGDAVAAHPGVDLQLSATLVEPIVRPARSPIDEQLDERRARARFHFRNDPVLGETDFPEDPKARDAALWRLALAARATSSYPVAFEASLVRSTRAATFGAPVDDAPGNLVDMRGIFSDRAVPTPPAGDGRMPSPSDPRPSDFVVADGGILDNIPLGKAITAIQQSSADRRTTRFLMYLQPGAPARGQGSDAGRAAPTSPERRRSTVGVLRGVVKAFYESESIAGDIAELEAHNSRVALGNVLRHGGFARVGNRADLHAAAVRELSSYNLHRAVDDTGLITRLLDDPVAELGEDLLARPAGPGADDACRSPLAAWPEVLREQLGGALTNVFATRITAADPHEERLAPSETDDVVLAGVRPLARLTTLLIEWARFLEERGGDPQVGLIKARLYRVAAFIEAALERPRRLGWLVEAIGSLPAATGGHGTMEQWVGDAGTALQRLVAVTPADAAALGPALTTDDGDRGVLGRVVADVRTRLDGAPPPTDGHDVRRVLCDTVLVALAEQLRAVPVPAPGSEPASGSSATPGDAPLPPGALLHRALSGEVIDATTLAALEVVCFPEFVAGAPGQRPIDFVRLSAGNRTPVARWFTALVAAADATGIPWEPPITATPVPLGLGDGPTVPVGGIPVAVKLAGNELANFAAFLRPAWRANDWMWGRLDAVPTLVDLLVTPASLRAWLSGPSAPADPLAALEAMVVGTDLGPDWQAWLGQEVWLPYASAVGAALTALEGPETGERVDVTAVRDALVCRRQWEVIADELGRSREVGIADRGVLAPDVAVAEAGTYATGTETLTDPKTIDTAEAFQGLAESAARTIRWHLRQREPVAGADPRSPGAVERAGGIVASGVRFAGGLAASTLLSPRSDGQVRKALVPSLLVAAIVGVFVWAVLEDWLAAVLTVAGFLLVAIAVAWLVLTARRRRARHRREVASRAGAPPAVLAGPRPQPPTVTPTPPAPDGDGAAAGAAAGAGAASADEPTVPTGRRP
jgi:patatin-related protein